MKDYTLWIGEKVVASDEARKVFHSHRAKILTEQALVMGFSKTKDCILVLFEGSKTKHSYHVDFWELAYPADDKR